MNGYGRIVKLEGEDGIQSWYAHHSKNLVEKGDWVDQGDVIALVGSTGNATGPHLHYEIHFATRHENETLDPLRFFPGEE